MVAKASRKTKYGAVLFAVGLAFMFGATGQSVAGECACFTLVQATNCASDASYLRYQKKEANSHRNEPGYAANYRFADEWHALNCGSVLMSSTADHCNQTGPQRQTIVDGEAANGLDCIAKLKEGARKSGISVHEVFTVDGSWRN